MLSDFRERNHFLENEVADLGAEVFDLRETKAMNEQTNSVHEE